MNVFNKDVTLGELMMMINNYKHNKSLFGG